MVPISSHRFQTPTPTPSPEVAKSVFCAFSKGRGDLPNVGVLEPFCSIFLGNQQKAKSSELLWVGGRALTTHTPLIKGVEVHRLN